MATRGYTALAVRIGGRAIGFLSGIVVARLLGANELGIIALAGTIVAICASLGRLGLENVLLRFASTAAEEGNWAQVGAILVKGFSYSMIACSVLTAALLLLSPTIAQGVFNEPGLSTPLRILALSIIPSALIILTGELLKAVNKSTEANFIETSAITLATFPVLIFMLFVVGSIEAADLAVISLIGSFGVFFYAWWRWTRAAPEVKYGETTFDGSRVMATALPLLVVGASHLLVTTTDILMLGIWRSSDQVGIYSVAARTALATGLPLAAINTVVGSAFARIYAQGEMQELRDYACNGAFLVTIATVPVAALLCFFPSEILFLFGNSFVPGAPSLIVLTLGQVVAAITGSVGFLLVMSGHEKLLRNTVIGGAVLNVILNAILIPSMGILGAAIATAASTVFINIVAWIVVYWKFSFFVFPTPVWSRSRASLHE